MRLRPTLNREFFEQSTQKVAQQLLGAQLTFGKKTGIITETEAYIGQDDPACHAARGLTPRTKIMYGPAGYSYVYLIYGMYYCFNIVTQQTGFPAAVLIRGLKTLDDQIHRPRTRRISYDRTGHLFLFTNRIQKWKTQQQFF